MSLIWMDLVILDSPLIVGIRSMEIQKNPNVFLNADDQPEVQNQHVETAEKIRL